MTQDAGRPPRGGAFLPSSVMDFYSGPPRHLYSGVDTEMIIGVWQAGMALRERQEMDEPTVLVAMRQMSQMWEKLFPIEQNRIVRLLIERVQLHEDGLDIIWCDDSWQRFCREMGRQPFVAEQREIVAEEIA